MKTATKTKKPIDEVEAKRKELRRLERQIEKAKIDLSFTWEMEERAKASLREIAKLVKASPDSIGQVVRGTLELLRKFYPKAHSANLYIRNATGKDASSADSCTIQIPLPTADAEKGGAA